MNKMNAIIRLLIVYSIFNMAFSCEKITEKSSEIYSTGKIIKITCGGTVLQFIDTDEIIGETWNNWMVPQGSPIISYSNCVLVGHIPINEFIEGDTIFIKYNKVDFFTIGGPWCAIGGLPKTLIEISDMLDSH